VQPRATPPTVAELLAITDDVVLLESLEQLLPLDDDRLVAARHMVETLTGVQMYLSANGIWQVLDVSSLADELHRVEAWWATLGAQRAAALAAAVGSLFPGGQVPDNEDARADRFMQLMENGQYGRPLGDPWYGTGIFTRLDREFADAVPDVARAVRELLRANASDPVSALVDVAERARRYVPGPRPTEWLEYADNGLDGKDAIEAWRERRREAIRKVGGTEKKAPVHDHAADERVLSFLDELEKLTADDWARVVSRRLHLAEMRHDLDIAFGAISWATPRALSRGAVQRLRDVGADDMHVRASLITRKLPAIALVDGQRAPLEYLSIRAAIQGADALLYRDDLMKSADGRRVLHVFLAPFEGYVSATIPPLE